MSHSSASNSPDGQPGAPPGDQKPHVETVTVWRPDRIPGPGSGEPKEIPGPMSPEKARLLYRSRAYDHLRPAPPARAVYKLGGVTFATAGNLAAVTAQHGSGKSSMVAAGLAAPMVGANDRDCLGLESANPEGHAVIHIDTEQSAADFDLLIRVKAIRRAGLDEPPPWLMSTCLTGCTPAEIVTVLETMMADAAREHGGIHSVWLDGVADAVDSPNDEEQSIALVRRLHALAIQHVCPIISILHLNPLSESKSRGHLGSQLERKAETVLQLKKTDEGGRDVTTIVATKTRHQPIPANQTPRFAWDDAAGMHMSIESRAAARASADLDEAYRIIRHIWKTDRTASFRYVELVRQAEEFMGQSKTTAKRKIGSILQMNLIHHFGPTGGYILSPSGSRAFEPELFA
jgi:hypothetical protein